MPLNPIRRSFWRFALCFCIGLCFTFLGSCSIPRIDSQAKAQEVLVNNILPNIEIQASEITDQLASRYTVDQILEPLPSIEEFPLYAAKPSGNANEVYLEIYSSSEKANADRQNERWLIEVAEAFNSRGETVASGKPIKVGIRQVASGTTTQLLLAQAAQPNGYSPSNDLWVEMVKSQGVAIRPVAGRLVPNTAGWVLTGAVYEQLAAEGEVTFDRIVDQVAAGSLAVGYPNPYKSSTALNMLYSLFWRAAGHQQDGSALTIADVKSPQVNSVFEQFQQGVVITTATTLDLQELFLRDRSAVQAFPLEYQNYVNLKQVSGFENAQFVPFGIPHNNPLVGFDWNTSEQQAALEKFAAFATSPPMQDLARQEGFIVTDYLEQGKTPPIPSGDVLLAAQSDWKLRKDAGRTAYMAVVVDTSGSMEGEPLRALQDGLRIASQYINPSNQISLITFSDHPVKQLNLQPFDEQHHKRFLAAVDILQPGGGTALYDGVMVGLSDLFAQQQRDPTGNYYLLLLSDGETNIGYEFQDIKDIMAYSGVRFYPIAYGEVNENEMQAIAQLRESTVKSGTPENVQELFKDLFQINL
ncbi:MAG: VWA domain-containing protein [Prochlorotrichaceae cyanobacterium]|jgi:Ca-activated chloride channel family protein